MKFEDLKLPSMSWHSLELARETARAVYDQMKAHYEAKQAKAKPEPEELFEHPDMPGKKFRRLKVGETVERGDWCNFTSNPTYRGWEKTVGSVDSEVTANDRLHFYREVSQPAPEWRLPDPPPGQKWHRDDWTQDMLPEGYRPLLLGEKDELDDEFWGNTSEKWMAVERMHMDTANRQSTHTRTRRPLPAPVEYVPLGPEDVPPGSAVRVSETKDQWAAVVGVSQHWLHMADAKVNWAVAAEQFEILRPGSTTWEPCKKPKA